MKSPLWLNFLGVPGSKVLHKLHHKHPPGQCQNQVLAHEMCSCFIHTSVICVHSTTSCISILAVYAKADLFWGPSDCRILRPQHNPMFTGPRHYGLCKAVTEGWVQVSELIIDTPFGYTGRSLFFSLMGGDVLTLSIHGHQLLMNH